MGTALRALLPNKQSLTASVLRAGVWVVAGAVFTRVAGTVRVMILGRLLQPSDFGVVALVTSVYVWLEQFGQTGLQATLIRKPGDIAPYLDTAWTMNLLRAILASAVMFISAPWVAEFLNTPELTPMLKFAAAGFLVRGFESPGLVYVRRNLNFSGEVRLTAGSTLVGLIVAIPLAIYLRSAWAIVIATLCSQIVQTATSYILQPYRPRMELNRTLARELMGFSRWIMWNNFATFPTRYLTGIMVGKVLGTVLLGFYQVAVQLAFSPTSLVGFALGGLALPAFAKVEGRESLRRAFLRVLSVLGAAVVPAASFVSVFAHLVIRVAMGEKWIASAPIAQLLVWAGAIAVMADISSQMTIREGHPKYVTAVNGANAALLLGCFYPVLKLWGNSGMAALVLVVYISAFLGQFFFLSRILEIRPQQFVQSQSIGVMAAAPFLAAGLAMQQLHLSYTGEAVIAAVALTCWAAIMLLLRHRIMELVSASRAKA